MKKIYLVILACSLPVWLCAQEAKPVDVEFPEAAAAPAAAPAVAVKKEAAPAEPVKTEAAAPKKVKKAAAPGKTKKAAAAGKKPVSRAPAPAGPRNPAKPGDRLVLPNEDPASRVLTSEFAAAAGIPHEALESGGFVVGKMYTVVKGDTLWDLSGKYYNNPFLWGKIYNANFRTVADPDRINPRDELIIPDINDVVVPYRRSDTAAAAAGAGEFVFAGDDPEFGAAPGAASGGRASAARKTGMPAPGEILREFDRDLLSEEMPEDQKEWSGGVKIVPDNWSEDGEITDKLTGESGSMDDSFSLSGEEIEISMNDSGMVKPGDYLAIYLKGGDAYAKSGKRLGRELQPAGLAEVVSVDGSTVRARVIDATTAISKGYIVKKK